MKRIFAVFVIITLILTLFAGCGGQLKATGCRVIRDEDKYVTFQVQCDNCGYEYGDPNTAYVGSTKLVFSVNCTQCREIIYVKLTRG